MSKTEEEIDLFDLSVESSDSGTETNVFSIEYDPSAGKIPQPMPVAPQPLPSIAGGQSGDLKLDLDLDIEDFSPAAQSSGPSAGVAIGSGDLDDVDDGADRKKGITQKIACVIGGLFGSKQSDFDDSDEDAWNGHVSFDDEDFSDLETLPDADDPTDLPYIPGDDDFSDLDSLPDAGSSIFSVTNAASDDALDLSVAETDAASFEAAEAGYETAAIEKVDHDDVSDFELTTAASPEEEPKFETITIPAVTSEPLPPPVFNRIAHVCLNVKNLERTIEYYENLGFQKTFAFNRNNTIFGIYLEFGKGNFIEIFENAGADGSKPSNGLVHFCLETDDLDATMESLDSRGIEYTPKKLGCDGTFQIWLKDPDGNEFEIHQYTPDSSQKTRKDVEADW